MLFDLTLQFLDCLSSIFLITQYLGFHNDDLYILYKDPLSMFKPFIFCCDIIMIFKIFWFYIGSEKNSSNILSDSGLFGLKKPLPHWSLTQIKMLYLCFELNFHILQF